MLKISFMPHQFDKKKKKKNYIYLNVEENNKNHLVTKITEKAKNINVKTETYDLIY